MIKRAKKDFNFLNCEKVNQLQILINILMQQLISSYLLNVLKIFKTL